MRYLTGLIVGAAGLALLPGAALAGDGNSKASLGYTHLEASGGDLGMITARYAYFPLKYMGIEGELGTGVLDETITEGVQSADISVDVAYGVYSVVQVPFDRFGSNIFVRAGYQSVTIDVESGANSISSELDGLGYGGGLNVMFSHHHGLRLDYTRLEGEEDSNADTYSLSYVLRF